MPDDNVRLVAEKLFSRARRGLEKYGTDTERPDVSTEGWLLHLQEELLDGAVYIERLLKDLQKVRGLLESDHES